MRNSFDVRKLFDYWSVSHFLFGTVTALFAITFPVSVTFMFFVTLYLAIFWELLEMRYRLSEARGNSVVDVLLSLVSFAVTFTFVDRADPNPEHHMALFIVTVILYLGVNYFSWAARFEHDREFRG